LRIDLKQRVVGQREIGIPFERLSALRDRLIIAAGVVKHVGDIPLNEQREWVQFLGAPNLSQRLVPLPHEHEVVGKPVVGRGTAGTELNGTAELPFGRRPIPVVMHFHKGEREQADTCLEKTVSWSTIRLTREQFT